MEFNVGDLVTTTKIGFFEITKISKRWQHKTNCDIILSETPITNYKGVYNRPYSSLIYYIQKYTENGILVNSNYEYCCDEAHLKLAKDVLKKRIKNYNKLLKTL